MVLTGRVSAKTDATVEIEIAGKNDLGHHVTGSVTLILPGAAGS
jgi:hypothetical protein